MIAERTKHPTTPYLSVLHNPFEEFFNNFDGGNGKGLSAG